MIEILVLDDNRGHATMIKACLNSDRAHVTVIDDGEDALRLLNGAQYRANLVLVEMQMPRFHGHEIVRRMRRRNPKLPIVVFSVSADQEDVGQAYASGANMYVEKPADPEAFYRAVRRIAKLWVEPMSCVTAAAAC